VQALKVGIMLKAAKAFQKTSNTKYMSNDFSTDINGNPVLVSPQDGNKLKQLENCYTGIQF
tara:strand:+ start:386 stop:568 length:183 start_codon:yes stop_codon:yes gene_type:complete